MSKYSTSKKNLFTILKRKVNKENIDKNNKLKLYAEISKIINDLENIKIINDGEYAENKIILFSSQGKSKYFIINYLKQKGIDNHLIVKTFETYEINNPYWEKELRDLSGLDQPVIEFLEGSDLVHPMAAQLKSFIGFWIKHFDVVDRSYLTVALGCTGGRHRSVYMVERLAREFRESAGPVQVRHRDLTPVKES